VSKKKIELTDLQFGFSILVIILLIIGLVYFAVLQDRFKVIEGGIGQDSFIKDNLDYNTEFCANRLTELAHEAHFLQKDINSKEEILGQEELVLSQEQDVIQIEQRELKEIQNEFEKYINLCDEFDKKPTKKTCTIFLQESNAKLDLAQKSADQTTGIEHFEIILKNLRNANRIYDGLQNICNIVK
jgi:hypothetical protein